MDNISIVESMPYELWSNMKFGNSGERHPMMPALSATVRHDDADGYMDR